MICIIPARKGSTRLPGKNTMDFFGQPIINHVVLAALESGVFEKVVVSSDDEWLVDVYNGVMSDVAGLLRPPEVSGDVAEDLVLRHACSTYKAAMACRIYPTAALLTASRIKFGARDFYDYYINCVMEAQRYSHPPQRGFTIDDGIGTYLKGDNVGRRTQDLIQVYHDAGTYMFFHVDALKKPLAERKILWRVVGEMEAQDIDTAEDFELAKLKFMRQGMVR